MSSSKPKKSTRDNDIPEHIFRLAVEADGRATKPEALMVQQYLTWFGYLSTAAQTIAEVVEAIKLFKKIYMGIKNKDLDGIPTAQVVRAMLEEKRCGCPDILRPENLQLDNPVRQCMVQRLEAKKKRKAKTTDKEVVLSVEDILSAQKEMEQQQLSKWGKMDLTYCIAQRVNGISAKDFDDVIKLAFDQISSVCGLLFQRVNNEKQADIVIGVGQGKRSGFDGASGTLAWAYLPGNGTTQQLLLKFDLDELWVTDRNSRGVRLLNVACHEIGHNCGLTHSVKPRALMAPTYAPDVWAPQQDDDVPRLQARYGQSRVTPTTPTPPPAPPTTGDEIVTIRVPKSQLTIEGFSLTKL